jgi:hypothetical protein
MIQSSSSKQHSSPRDQERTPFSLNWEGEKAARAGVFLPGIFLVAILCLSACRSQPHTSTPTLTLPPSSTPAPAPSPTATVPPTATLTSVPAISLPKIDRAPRTATIEDWAPWAGQTLTTTLKYDPASPNIWQTDYRTQNLSQLDLRYMLNDLLLAYFDDRTIWPSSNKLPFGFNPQRIMELGKNPGLGVRSLHDRGITGKGIGIALIDMPLLVDHQEYNKQLRLYEELFFYEEAYQQPAQMHGPQVASIAVGKTAGVAPEADLYYIAVDLANGQDSKGDYQYDFTKAAQAIRRILEINQQLPSDRKIRVISMSFGWASTLTGYEEISAAVAEARTQGVFVVCAYPAMEQIYGFKLYGLERTPLADPDLFVSYSRAHFCDLYASVSPLCQAGTLLVPMNSRTAASPMGKDEYVFYRMGEEGNAMPYLAGIYALAAQVDPEITPERFWELVMQTGRSVDISGTSGMYTIGPILDPVSLINSLEISTGNRSRSGLVKGW